MATTMLFVPGFWEGSAPFARVISLLQSQSYPTQIATLLSTGKASLGNPSMKDNIAAVRSIIADLVNAEKNVALVLHSAGGFLGVNAAEGLDVKARYKAGLNGGVSKIVFLAGAVFPEGFKHTPLPFFTYDGGAMHCVDPENNLFGDLSPEEATKWVKALQIQPAAGWDDTVTYGAWKEVPSVYLMCEGNACLPAAVQLQMAGTAGSKVEKCAAGHMPMISMPERVVEVVEAALEEA